MKIVLLLMAYILCLKSYGNQSLNMPKISANGLFLLRNSNYSSDQGDVPPNGLSLQEAEIAMYSDVDPYTKFNLFLAIHQEFELDESDNTVGYEYHIEPEELYVESNFIEGFTLKLGKLRSEFGKHNILHTHAFPLITEPLFQSHLLGEEGLVETGLSVAYLMPFSWFSEFTVQVYNGESQNFSSPSPGDAATLAKYKNLWDLNESWTSEVGVSYMTGHNYMNYDTSLIGGDLTFKYRPTLGGKYRSAMFNVEFVKRSVEQGVGFDKEEATGWSILGKYQLGQRWFVVVRTEKLKASGILDDVLANAHSLEHEDIEKNSLGLEFNPTEFSSFRLEYSQIKGIENSRNEDVENLLLLQGSFTIGAHPAHKY